MPARSPISAQDIPEDQLREEFICTASGPGGQHVNRTANTVRLFFDADNCPLLTPAARIRLKQIIPCDESGMIVITCRESRSLAHNRTRAREILAELISKALPDPRKRKKTRPTRASRERRLRTKAHRSQIKAGRSGKFE